MPDALDEILDATPAPLPKRGSVDWDAFLDEKPPTQPAAKPQFDYDAFLDAKPQDRELTPPTDEGTNPTTAKITASEAGLDEPFNAGEMQGAFRPAQWASTPVPYSSAKDLALDAANVIGTKAVSLANAPSTIANALFQKGTPTAPTAAERRQLAEALQSTLPQISLQLNDLQEQAGQIPRDDPNADPRANAALEAERRKNQLGQAILRQKLSDLPAQIQQTQSPGDVTENLFQAGVGENAKQAAKDYDFVNQVTQSRPETQGNLASQLVKGGTSALIDAPMLAAAPGLSIPAMTLGGMSQTAIQKKQEGVSPEAQGLATLAEGIKQAATLYPFIKGAQGGAALVERAIPQGVQGAGRFLARTAGNTGINELLTSGINLGENAITGENNPIWSPGQTPMSLALALMHAREAGKAPISKALRPETEAGTMPGSEQAKAPEGTPGATTNAPSEPAGGEVPVPPPERDYAQSLAAFRDGKTAILEVPKGEPLPRVAQGEDTRFKIIEKPDGTRVVYDPTNQAARLEAEKGLEPAGGEPQNPSHNEPAPEAPFQPQGNTIAERIKSLNENRLRQSNGEQGNRPANAGQEGSVPEGGRERPMGLQQVAGEEPTGNAQPEGAMVEGSPRGQEGVYANREGAGREDARNAPRTEGEVLDALRAQREYQEREVSHLPVGGGEHSGQLNPQTGRFEKVTNSGHHGVKMEANRAGKIEFNLANAAEYAQRMKDLHDVFGVDTRLKGVTTEGRIVSDQADYSKGRYEHKVDIANAFRKEGFHPIGDDYYYRPEDNLLVGDAGRNNVAEGEDGRIKPYDALITHPEGKLQAMAERGLERSAEVYAELKKQKDDFIVRQRRKGQAGGIFPPNAGQRLAAKAEAKAKEAQAKEREAARQAKIQEQETKLALPRTYDTGQTKGNLRGDTTKRQVNLALKESIDRTGKGWTEGSKAHNEDLDRRAASFVEEAGGSKEQYERDVNELKNQTAANLRSNDPAIRQKAQAVQKWLNKGGNEVLAHGQEHFDRIHQAIEPYREVMKQQRQAEINNGIKIGDRDNYVSHLFHHEEGTMFGGGSGQGARYFTKKGNFKTLLEGLIAGHIPKTTDLAELAQNRVSSGQKMVAERQWVESLQDMQTPDGRPMIRPAEGKAEGFSQGGVALPDSKNYKQILVGGKPMMVDRKFSRVIENLTKGSSMRDYAVGRVALKGAAGLKHVMLAMDTFHASRMAQKGAAQGQFGYQKPLSILEYRPEDLQAAVRQGELTQAEADYANQNHEKAMFLIDHGLNVGQISDNIMHLLSTKIPVISTFNNWTFQKMTRGIMLGSALKNFDRTSKAHPDWSKEKVAQYVSKETNENFGSLGNQGLVTNKTLRDAMRVAFLAPQWVESQVRTEGRTYGQAGKALVGQGVGNLARGSAIGVGSYFALAQLINFATRGKPTWENEEPGHFMDAYIPLGGKQGMWFDPKSTFLEYTHSLTGNYAKTAGGALGLKEAGQQVLKNKLGPLVQAEERFRTGQNWKGEKDRTIGETLKGTLAEAAPLPINLSQMYDKTKGAKQGFMEGFKNPLSGNEADKADKARQLASSLGFKMDRALSPRENLFRAASPYRSDSGYHGPPSPYRDLDRALSSGDLKAAAAEIKRLQNDKTEQKAVGGTIAPDARQKVMSAIDKHYGLQPGGTTRQLTPELYTGSKESEERFKAGMSNFDRKQYAEAQKDRQTAAQLYSRAKAMAGVQ